MGLFGFFKKRDVSRTASSGLETKLVASEPVDDGSKRLRNLLETIKVKTTECGQMQMSDYVSLVTDEAIFAGIISIPESQRIDPNTLAYIHSIAFSFLNKIQHTEYSIMEVNKYLLFRGELSDDIKREADLVTYCLNTLHSQLNKDYSGQNITKSALSSIVEQYVTKNCSDLGYSDRKLDRLKSFLDGTIQGNNLRKLDSFTIVDNDFAQKLDLKRLNSKLSQL